jgi:hypothetical protein
MIFEKAPKEELTQFIFKWMKTTEEPIFIVDQDYKIAFVNSSFENFTHNQESQIMGHDFGNALGCRYLNKDNKACGLNYYCDLCGFRDVIRSAIEKNTDLDNTEVVRDFNLENETVIRYMRFKAVNFNLNNQTYAMIIVNKTSINPDNDALNSWQSEK